jgi:hypothetical protein
VVEAQETLGVFDVVVEGLVVMHLSHKPSWFQHLLVEHGQNDGDSGIES